MALRWVRLCAGRCRHRVSPDRSSHRELNAVAFAAPAVIGCGGVDTDELGDGSRILHFLTSFHPKKVRPRRNRIRKLVDAAR